MSKSRCFHSEHIRVSQILTTVTKAMAEICMGWRNHLKNSVINQGYQKKMREFQILDFVDTFKGLRDNFLHKREDAITQYRIKLTVKRGGETEAPVILNEEGENLITLIKQYYEAQIQLTKLFVQEIENYYSEQLKEAREMIQRYNLPICLNPTVI